MTTKPKRRVRNFLLDARLQLTYAGWVGGVGLVVAVLMGASLWRAQRALIGEAEVAVDARSRAADASRELSNAVLSKELLARFEDPSFVAELETRSKTIDAAYETERKEIVAQRAQLGSRQRMALWTLILACVGLIVFGTLFTIVLTHRLAGPLFRLRRIVHDVTDGRLSPPTHGLRKGDDLQDLFELFSAMVQSLRGREEAHLARTERVLAELERAGAPSPALAELRELREDLKTRLG